METSHPMCVDGREVGLAVREVLRFHQRLLGAWCWRGQIPPGRVLRIVPCAAVHTLCLPRAIEVAFCARDGRILKLLSPLAPWRFAACRGAHSVWEFRTGTSLRLGLEVGQRLALAPTGGRP